ncbi:hypothetical protein OHB24_15195 [Kribbella sp. NBC_00482]|uniref:hypothetical protein n=1 Tax=Kribbella sp. NBC_00482 TaxID=2975968 RepID=UPI002E19D5F4
MNGNFLQVDTPALDHHANQTASYADSLGHGIRQGNTVAQNMVPGFDGDVGRMSLQVHENRDPGLQRGQVWAQGQSDGVRLMNQHYEQMSAFGGQRLGAVPTA